MDLSDVYNQIAKLKMQNNNQPDLNQIDHVTAAGIPVRPGDPRIQTGFTTNNLNPQELAKWNAYIASKQGQ